MNMNGDPAFLKTVSLHLARVLDEIGLNQVTVDRRRRAFLFIEHSKTTIDSESTVYHFGSQTEGATTPGLYSDLDELICAQEFHVIQDWAEWQAGKMNILMLHEDTAPGYCRLQVLRSDIPMAIENLVDDENYIYDSSSRVIIKNTLLNQSHIGSVRNGPAQSGIGIRGFMDTDFVQAVKCGSWPRQAEEFIRRQRRYTWPTHGLVQQAVEQGCFIVPVGHKLSPTEHLEWRLSASVAERYLMFSLNIVHLKVYVLLKMLVKSFVEPRARKCISSYHCKTALLYCTENTESEFWIEENILQCVTRCLAMLVSWVTEGFCPQFIFADDNLFAGKVTVQNRGTVQSILKDLKISNGRVLLGVRIDDLGHKLQAHLSKEPSAIPIIDSPATAILIGRFENERNNSTKLTAIDFRIQTKTAEPITVIRSIYIKIVILKGRIRQLDTPKRQATEAIIEFLYGWLGSLLASISLSYKMSIPRLAIQLLYIGTASDVDVMLKLASVLYSNGDYRKVETVLQKINNKFSNNMIEPICICYDKAAKRSPEFHYYMMYVLRGRKAHAKLCAYCVVFTRQEIHCVPPALRNELFRSIGDDPPHRYPDKWMDLAAVDCLPYLHYLQYITYWQLGKHDLQKQSLLNLERCIKEDNAFGHLETAWNLLGQCMELEKTPEAAMTCYMTSLQIRPRNNAANWHMQHLCYTQIKNGCLPI